jgi:hypothetical protein
MSKSLSQIQDNHKKKQSSGKFIRKKQMAGNITSNKIAYAVAQGEKERRWLLEEIGSFSSKHLYQEYEK